MMLDKFGDEMEHVRKTIFVVAEHVLLKTFWKKLFTIWGVRDWGIYIYIGGMRDIYNWGMRDWGI